jgi:pimeloyl-ACP methyl ester carboxylesterase
MTLYLLHGALGSATQLEPLAEAMRATGDVRVLELGGHGRTSLGQRPFSIEGFADQVIGRLDADGVASADFFGYSMGGYVALTVAVEHPGRVRHIATLGTKFEWLREIAAREASRLDPWVIREKVPQFGEQLKARHAESGGWEANLKNTAALVRALGEAPTLSPEVLGRIETQVCITVGDRDPTVSVEESARASRTLIAGSLAVLPNTAHPLEQVDVKLLASILLLSFAS